MLCAFYVLYVCMYVYVSLHTYVCMYVYVSLLTYECMYVYVSLLTYVCMYVYVSLLTYECMYVIIIMLFIIILFLENLDNLVPDKWYSSYHYSHPPLVERLRALKAAPNDEKKGN